MSALDADEVVDYLSAKSLEFEVHDHGPAGTSEESFAARLAVTGRAIVGAKALVLRVKHASIEELVLVILRGPDRVSSRLVQRALLSHYGSRPRTSFADPEEIAAQLRGLEPGRVPPLGPPLLPAVTRVLVDQALLDEPEVGFNAADFNRSVIMSTKELRKALPPSAVVVHLSQAR